MRRLLSVCIICMVFLVGCGEQLPKGAVPFSSEKAKGLAYGDIQKQLEEIGFENIRVEFLSDLEKADEADIENTIQEISIAGNSVFKENKKFEFDSEIIIKYHSYKESPLPLSTSEVKGAVYDEIKDTFDKSAFFNIKYELITDSDKDNIHDNEIEYITINDETFDINKSYSVADKITIYHSLIEKTMPILSHEAKGMSYDEVMKILSGSQFAIESKLIRDTDIDNAHENEVEYIEINSTSDYTMEDTFPIGTKIVVYHSHIEDKMPISSEDAKGMTYEDVLKLFDDTKFKNIKIKSSENVADIEPTETTVNSILVNNAGYTIDKTYPYDSEIVVDYSIKRYDVSVILECDKNLLFNKYNIDVSFDDDYKGGLEHGSKFSFTDSLKKGKYTLTLKSAEDSDIVKNVTIDIPKDLNLRFSLTCNSSSIDVTNYPQTYVPYTNENVEGEKLENVITAFENAGFTNIETKALNDLDSNSLKLSNTVTEISINNKNTFKKDTVCYSDDKVIVYYHSGKTISVPLRKSDATSMNYKEVVQMFKDAGFINVSAEKYAGDNYYGARDSLTESVSVAGETSFYKDDKISLDAPIVVYYYSINYENVTVAKMMSDMENNAYNAKDYYDDNYFAVTGYVDRIDENGRDIDIVASTSGWDFLTVTCKVKDSEQEEVLKKLSKNKKVTIKGQITLASDWGYNMDIHEIIVR